MVDTNDAPPPIDTDVDIAEQVNACFVDEKSSMEAWGNAPPGMGGRDATGRNDLPQDRNILK